MNNKKLFKGALVLFASILMAVSCSSNSKPEDENSNNNNTEKPLPTFTITLSKAGVEATPFSVNAKANQTSGADFTETATVAISPEGLKATDITLSPISFEKKSGPDNLTTPFEASEFSLDLSTGKLKITGKADRASDANFTSTVKATITFKATAKGYEDSTLVVYADLKHE